MASTRANGHGAVVGHGAQGNPGERPRSSAKLSEAEDVDQEGQMNHFIQMFHHVFLIV